MNLSHEWLARLVPHGRTPEAIRELLTAHVATVEGFEPLRADLAPFVVGRVVESEQIPDTKLSFNKVDDGTGALLEVVCGAPKVVVGARYPFARTGTVMPGGLTIEKRKIRGFTSNGMLCSARELGLGEDHEGILALETDAAPGTPLLRVLPLGDVRLVLDVLPNRPDLLSHLGVARELSALTGVALQGPPELADLPPVPGPLPAGLGATEANAGGLSVRIEDSEGCPRYTAAVITGVTVCPSPPWLKACVEAVGGRSINNVVDATNYLLHGFGQPMHAFDRAKLGGAKAEIVVRRARAGEALVTLDGVSRKLTPEMLVIADRERATALAGVMGGRGSEVTDATTEIVLEVASFSPTRVRATRRATGLSSDASYRFERGVDDAMLAEALAVGAALLAHVSGGHVEAVLLVGVPPEPRKAVALRPERVSQLLGADVPRAEVVTLLRSIGFKVEDDGSALRVTAPSWRHDIARDVDLIEEVARLRGFDRLPDLLQGSRPGTVPDHPLYTASLRVRDALVAAGLHEVRPLPFTKGDVLSAAGLVRVTNPLAEDEPFLRGSLLDTLARRAEFNLNRMQGDVRLFEVGNVFAARPGALPREEVRAGLIVMGRRRPPHFTESAPPAFDAWDAKALAELVSRAAFPGEIVLVEATPFTAEDAAGRGGSRALWTIRVNATAVGSVVQVMLDAPVWASPAFGVELTIGEISNAIVAAPGKRAVGSPGSLGSPGSPGSPSPRRFKPLPVTPAAEFDLALLVPDAIAASAVERVLRAGGGETLEQCVLFDEFRGAGVAAGMRSLAWRLTFRHPERTLREKEIEGRRSQLLKTLEKELGVRPRSA